MKTAGSHVPDRARPFAGMALVLLGTALLVVSFIWSGGTSAGRDWTEQDALSYQQLGSRFHALAHQRIHDADPADPLQQQYLETKQAYEAQRARLDQARASRSRFPVWLRWSGVAAIASGLIGLSVSRRGS